jgi:hypothetical protein
MQLGRGRTKAGYKLTWCKKLQYLPRNLVENVGETGFCAELASLVEFAFGKTRDLRRIHSAEAPIH